MKAREGNWRGVVGSITPKKKVKVKGITAKYKKLKKPTIKYNGAPSTASDLEAAYNTKGLKYKIVASPRTAMNNYFKTTASGGIYRITDDYLNIAQGVTRINPRNVCPVNIVDDRMPGTYKNEFLAVGGGIDHGEVFVRKYKRVGIKLKEAEKTNNPQTGMILFKATCAASSAFNVTGAYPQDLKIYFNGHMNDFSQYGLNKPMYYNGQVFPITDQYGNTINVKIRAYNNTKVGKAYFVVEGDGKVFKGKSAKIPYEVVARGYTGIPVRDSEYWYVDDGKQIPLTLKKGEGYAGFVYATMSAGKKYKGGVPKKRDITLYQAYYKNAADYAKDKKTLKKIDPKYYSLSFSKTVYNNYTVKVSKGKTAGFNWQDSSVLDKPYTVYDKVVKIKQVGISTETGSYVLPNSKAVPELFTGKQIKPKVDYIVLSNGKQLFNDGKNYTVKYGSNIKAGKKAGSITIVMKQNTTDWNFQYGGSQTFYFNIGTHPGRTL